MAFLAAWAFSGLALLAPLVLVHLRRRADRTRVVRSLLLWQECDLQPMNRRHRLALPPLPLLLAFQAAALVALIVALAQPVRDPHPTPEGVVIVLDDSYWMSSPGTLARAKTDVLNALRSAPGDSPVRVVLAEDTPSILYRGPASGAARALASVRAGTGAPNLRAALTLAASQLTSRRDRLIVAHAPQDKMPPLRAPLRGLHVLVAGDPSADQGIFDPSVRCGTGGPSKCTVVATIVNPGATAVSRRVAAQVPGRPALRFVVRVQPRSKTQIQMLATPGDTIRLTMLGSDAVPSNDSAWVTVPDNEQLPRPATVTVVGTRDRAQALAQAFAAVPGVKLGVSTPANYRATLARNSDLLVLDGWLPPAGIPPAPAVMLVDPPRFPGGEIAKAQVDPTPSGTDAGSPLLEGVDISALTVQAGAARGLSLPDWVSPVIWSPSGPLLAAGDNGRTRLVVTTFDIGGSNLAQLTAFPVLAANITRWALGWAPGTAVAGTPFQFNALPGATWATLRRNGMTVARVALADTPAVLNAPVPGAYTLTQTGPGVTRTATIDVNLRAPSAHDETPLDLQGPRVDHEPGGQQPLRAWFLAAALLVLVVELAYWSVLRQRGAI